MVTARGFKISLAVSAVIGSLIAAFVVMGNPPLMHGVIDEANRIVDADSMISTKTINGKARDAFQADSLGNYPAAEYLLRDGSVALTGDWAAGDYDITGLDRVEADSAQADLVGFKETGSSPTYYCYVKGGDQAANLTFTWPADYGSDGQLLKTDGAGTLAWTDAAAGDITAVGDVASGAAFTADGEGDTLWFEGSTVDAIELLLVAENPTTSDKTMTLPNFTGYAVVDVTKCTDVEGTGLSISGGTLNWAANIADLGDVTISSPADNEVLAYDQGTTDWINQTASEAGLATSAIIGDTADVLRGEMRDTATVVWNDSAVVALRKDGSVALTGDWAAGDFDITGLDRLEADTVQGDISGFKETGGSEYYTYFKGGNQSGNITYTWPVADGSDEQVLKTNGSGTLTWGAAGSSENADSLQNVHGKEFYRYLASVTFGNDASACTLENSIITTTSKVLITPMDSIPRAHLFARMKEDTVIIVCGDGVDADAQPVDIAIARWE